MHQSKQEQLTGAYCCFPKSFRATRNGDRFPGCWVAEKTSQICFAAVLGLPVHLDNVPAEMQVWETLALLQYNYPRNTAMGICASSMLLQYVLYTEWINPFLHSDLSAGKNNNRFTNPGQINFPWLYLSMQSSWIEIISKRCRMVVFFPPQYAWLMGNTSGQINQKRKLSENLKCSCEHALKWNTDREKMGRDLGHNSMHMYLENSWILQDLLSKQECIGLGCWDLLLFSTGVNIKD